MNPLSLLTKGRTVKNLRERPGHYKLLGGSVVPKFSKPKNPFPTTPHPEPQKAQAPLFAQAQPAPEARKEEIKPVAPKVSTFVETSAFAKAAANRVAEKKSPEESGKSATPITAQARQSQPGWWSQLAVRSVRFVQSWISRRKIPAVPRATVQAELALEKIKVIRNDFSEDDLEVVMIDKKAGKKADKPAQSEKIEREKLTAYS